MFVIHYGYCTTFVFSNFHYFRVSWIIVIMSCYVFIIFMYFTFKKCLGNINEEELIYATGRMKKEERKVYLGLVALILQSSDFSNCWWEFLDLFLHIINAEWKKKEEFMTGSNVPFARCSVVLCQCNIFIHHFIHGLMVNILYERKFSFVKSKFLSICFVIFRFFFSTKRTRVVSLKNFEILGAAIFFFFF